ncbi:hypothetical protein L210DRAFT_510107 [Boletus edulis BED1]|uniref:Uncharacterized protein n=1 Tax=Boletus edulis BED1 TaxID=1328754 RepID=A0AAD4BIJ2_BOLED|nr:hypothetical protein L210DRAFT_510107 [Boletus edulis BED1]
MFLLRKAKSMTQGEDNEWSIELVWLGERSHPSSKRSSPNGHFFCRVFLAPEMKNDRNDDNYTTPSQLVLSYVSEKEFVTKDKSNRPIPLSYLSSIACRNGHNGLNRLEARIGRWIWMLAWKSHPRPRFKQRGSNLGAYPRQITRANNLDDLSGSIILCIHTTLMRFVRSQ